MDNLLQLCSEIKQFICLGKGKSNRKSVDGAENVPPSARGDGDSATKLKKEWLEIPWGYKLMMISFWQVLGLKRVSFQLTRYFL